MDGPAFFQLLLDLYSITPTALAREVGNPSLQSGFQRYKERASAEPKRSTLQPAADWFGVNVEAFYSPEVLETELRRISSFKYKHIPGGFYESAGSEGLRLKDDAGMIFQLSEGDVALRNEWLAEAETFHKAKRNWLRSEAKNRAPVAATNVTHGPRIRGKVPLISWVRAGELCEAPDNFQPGQAEEWLDCPVPHGPRTYCLSLSGDSMDDGSSDAYRDGEIIFVDPDASADPGRDVVVRTPDNKTTFKRLKEDMEGQYLLGLNGKKIVRVPEGTEFCGVVIFSGRRR